MHRRLISFLKASLFCFGILTAAFWGLGWTSTSPKLKNGIWRATLHRPDGQQIVFNFIAGDSGGKKVLYVINAEERLLVDSIVFKKDSVFIQMPFFESSFRARLTPGGNLRGLWTKRSGATEQILPFEAVYNQRQRFAAPARPRYNVSGRWAVHFTKKDNKVVAAVGEFSQKGSRLTGTFLLPTGDYRYLEGVVTGDSLKLSCFDGSHAYLFTAKIENDSTLSGGQFYAGATGQETWVAHKNAAATLPEGSTDQTHMREGETNLNFRFPAIDGGMVSIKDPVFANKVVVVQIMGSWCPNCMDETAFLSDYYNANRQKGVEVVAIAYERSTDFERSKASLERFQKRFQVQYPMLVAGAMVSDPLRTEKTLPQLDQIKVFPTTIFIDKKGRVRKIHSGFNGPGTGLHYEQFKKEFDDTINALLKEE